MNNDAIFDVAAYEAFRDELIATGFGPVPGTEQMIWRGPIRESLAALTEQPRMSIRFPDGWPLRYAKTQVEGLVAPHSADGSPCLWADDDPAQVAGARFEPYVDRLDEWALRAAAGFEHGDLALDGFLHFESLDERGRTIEVPFGDLTRYASNGQIDSLTGRWQGEVLRAAHDSTGPLDGVMYFSTRMGEPPRTLDDLRGGLTRRQRMDFEYRLERQRVGIAKPASGRAGVDFVVVAWPTPIGIDVIAGLLARKDGKCTVQSLRPAPSDNTARRMRAGVDADRLADKRVLVVGAGSVGGYVAVALAESGLGAIEVADSETLLTANLVRHIAPSGDVGKFKAMAVAGLAADHAPWAEVSAAIALPMRKTELEERLNGFDLIVDCTGDFAVTAALVETSFHALIPLLTGALYHQGNMLRIRRQSKGDVPIARRADDSRYLALPRQSQPSTAVGGFMEVGCTAPVNAAPPWAAMRAASEVVEYAIDALTCQRLPDERVVVLREQDSSGK